ncbi:MAG: tRNA-specific adenosine deaminase [Bryobacterales bacterium]|nr:tRNA-specific adenosine deaminase [Bryobacterales bacterium]
MGARKSDEFYMELALEQARQAEAAGEVPVGAVVVCGGEVVGSGYNQPIACNDPSAHAEVLAIRQAAAHLGNYRLPEAALFVTMEPCVMCAGLIVNARIAKLIFGARDLRFGGVRSKFRLADSPLLNHRVEVVEGVLGAQSTALVRKFFAARRGSGDSRAIDG